MDAELRVSVTPSAIPELVISTYRYSLAFAAWIPADSIRCQRQFSSALIEAIAHQAGLTVTVAPARDEAGAAA